MSFFLTPATSRSGKRAFGDGGHLPMSFVSVRLGLSFVLFASVLGCNEMIGLTPPELIPYESDTSCAAPTATTSSSASQTTTSSTASQTTISSTAMGEWVTILPLLSIGRAFHTATLMWNGEVLLWGGCANPDNEPAEVLFREPNCTDPSSCWYISQKEGEPCRFGHAAFTDARGRVVAVGGFKNIKQETQAISNTTYYDPRHAEKSLEQAPGVLGAGFWTATLLGDGRVFFRGGIIDLANLGIGPLPSTTMYMTRDDFDGNGQFVEAPGVTEQKCDEPGTGCPNRRAFHTATLLGDGSVLVAGGIEELSSEGTDGSAGLTATEWFLPSFSALVPQPGMSIPRWHHAAVRLADGRVLLCGGRGRKAGKTAEIYDPATGFFKLEKQHMRAARWGHTATLLNDGRVLVVGGSKEPSAEIYDPIARKWTFTSPMKTVRYFHTATRLPNGDVLVAGGEPQTALAVPLPVPDNYSLNSLELYVVPHAPEVVEP